MNETVTTPTRGPGTAVPKSGTSRPRPQRILVADDDVAVRELSRELLIRFGYGVDDAEDGAAAWQALNADTYDLLITDHNMPKVSGVELLKKVRAARMTLPVILVSGLMPLEELSRHSGLRIEATLQKPFTFEELLGTVHQVLHAANETPFPPNGSRLIEPILCNCDPIRH